MYISINYECSPKVLQHFYTFVKINGKGLQFFSSVVNLNVLLATGALWNSTVSHSCIGVIKMAWYGDVPFKQPAVTKFLWQRRNQYRTFISSYKMYMVSVLLIKVLLVIGLHELLVLRKAKWSSVMRVTLAAQQQQLLRCCFSVLMNSFKMTDGLQPESLQLSCQCPRKV
jgi:hypothetical protein